MKTVWEKEAREEVAARIRALPADRAPQWGRMNAPQMIAHLSDQIRIGLGHIPARNGEGPYSFWPMNTLAIYVIPWPHGFKGPFETFTTKPATWDADRETLIALIDDLNAKREQARWPQHPTFGKMSGKDWAALTYRHCQHHLGQFGA